VSFLVRVSGTPLHVADARCFGLVVEGQKEDPECDHPESQSEQDAVGAVRRGRVGGGVLGGVRLKGLIAGVSAETSMNKGAAWQRPTRPQFEVPWMPSGGAVVTPGGWRVRARLGPVGPR
jgi:hypothetical protein